jgi:hypothetical protein
MLAVSPHFLSRDKAKVAEIKVSLTVVVSVSDFAVARAFWYLSSQIISPMPLLSDQIQSLTQLEQLESESSCLPQKHDSLYLFDGNIVLMAPTKSGGTTIFRVHQSMLFNHSPIFANMLKAPVSDEVQMYDGIRLVRLTDDAEEIESVFKLMYIQL